MLYVMAGEDESKDLQEGEDSYYRRLVSEEGGFGSNTNSGFNSQESTDVDSRDAITSFGDDSDYDMVDRDDEEDDDNFDGDDEDFDNDAEDFDGDDDDYDDEYGYDDYDDEDEDEEDEEDDEDEDENDENDDEDGEGGGKGKKGKKDKNQKGKGKGGDKGQFTKVKKRKISPEERAAMKAKKDEIFAKMLGVKFIWHEGEEITLKTLQQYWSLFAKHVPDLKEYMNQADEVVKEGLETMTCGPNLVLNSKAFLKVLGYDSGDSMIQHILNLISAPGVTLLYGIWSAIEAIGSQQWLETTLIFGLKTGMKTVLKMGIVQGIMEHIFSKGMKELKKKFNYKGIVVAPK